MIAIYEHNGTLYTVTLERLPDGRYAASIGGRAMTFEAQAVDGGWRLVIDDERMTAYTAARGSERYVSINGESATLTVPDARSTRRRGTGAGSGELTAQMPGQVTAVLVQHGDHVERGQALVILEAMKMETRVTAPDAVRVKRVLVKPGDVVERGQRLVEIEAES